MILNYLDLKKSGFLGDFASLKKHFRKDSIIILSCVGEDRLLDKMRIENYCRTAIALGAQAVISPDDYIYEVDHSYHTYQDHHFRRVLERTETLIEKAKDRFSIIGLVVWTNRYHIELYVKRLREHGVDDFAYACGDVLKRVSPEIGLSYVRRFMKHCIGGWKLLLGVDSREILLKLKPCAFSSSGWSFDATRGKVYDNREIDPFESAYHNLEQNFKLGEAIGRSYKGF